MRRFAAILFLLGFLFIGGKSVRAQYYSWGADAAALRWKHLRTEDVRVVFPDTASALAHRTLYYIQAVRPTITHGFSHPPLKIPFVLHTENFQSNGLVMWMPKRIEFLTTPSVDSYSMPWVKQLVAHEYRHAVQYNNLNRGLIRILSYLIGQQGSTVGLLFMPLWALEGDAVMNETEMSSYGRGRQPRFTIEYRALGYEVLRRRNCDKWFCGSFRDFVPDHYQMGYQMVAYGYDRYGDGIWDKTLRYGVRNAYMLTFSTSVALRKFYGTGEGILFRDAFADLNRFWDSLPKVTDSGRTLTPLPEKNYTTYTHPVSLNDTTLVALKTDFDRPSRLVAVDSRTGRERRRTWTGLVSSRPTTDGQRVWWTEYRRSLLFPERVNSRLVVLAPGKKRPRNAPKLRNVLYPTPIGRSGALAWVEYTPDGHYTIVAEDSLRQRTAWPMPGFSEVHGLAWDNATERLYTLVTDNSGMWIGRIEPGEGLQAVTRGAYITLSDLRAADGKLYYGSIASGRDEAHCFDLGEGPSFDFDLRQLRPGSRRQRSRLDDHLRPKGLPHHPSGKHRTDSGRPVATARRSGQSAPPPLERGQSRHGTLYPRRLGLPAPQISGTPLPQGIAPAPGAQLGPRIVRPVQDHRRVQPPAHVGRHRSLPKSAVEHRSLRIVGLEPVRRPCAERYDPV